MLAIDAPVTVDPSEDEMVRTHLPLVQYLVTEISGRVPRHVSRDDLVSAGMVGLAQAARSFDPDRSVSFSRFAATRIRGAILDELRSRDWASRSVRARAREQSRASDRLTATLGRPPTRSELANELGVDVERVDAVNRDAQRSTVLNLEGLGADGTYADLVPASGSTPDAVLMERERRAYLVAAVANLPERLRRVVLGSFFDELPMRALADELGVTESRISQMRSEALRLLGAAIDAQLEPKELDVTAIAPLRRTAYVKAVATHYDFRRRLEPTAGSLASLAHARTA